MQILKITNIKNLSYICLKKCLTNKKWYYTINM